MNLLRFQSSQEFLARAEHFLLEHEAENNLPLGISATLTLNPNLYGSQPYFAVIEEAGQVVGAALMTPPHLLVLALMESPAIMALLAPDVRQFRPDLPGTIGPAQAGRSFVQQWQALTGQSARVSVAERIYKLEVVKHPVNVSGRLRRVVESDRPLLQEWLPAFQQEAMGSSNPESVERSIRNTLTLPPEFRGSFVWEDPQPVSLVSYGNPSPHGMLVGPVYTPPMYRGRGYASACTAAVSQYLLDSGRRFVFLFTDLANPTSNKIYQRIGYTPICDVDEYRFTGRS